MNGHAWRLLYSNSCPFLYETVTIQAKAGSRVQHHGKTFSVLTLNLQRERARTKARATRSATQNRSHDEKSETKRSEPPQVEFNPLSENKLLSAAERKAFESLMGVAKKSGSPAGRVRPPSSVRNDLYDLDPERIVSLFHHSPKKVRGQIEEAETRGRGFNNPLKFITILSQFFQKAIETSEAPEHALWRVFQDLVLPLCLCADHRYVQRTHRELDPKTLLLGHLDLDAASMLPQEETVDYNSLTGGRAPLQTNGQPRMVMTSQLRGILEDLDRSYKLPQLRTTLFPAAVLLTLRMFASHAPTSPHLEAVLPTLRIHLPNTMDSQDTRAANFNTDLETTAKPVKSVQDEILNHAHIYNPLLAVQRDIYHDAKSIIAILSDMYARKIRGNDDTLSILRGVVSEDPSRSTAEMGGPEGLEEWWTRPAQVSGVSRILTWLGHMEESRNRRGRKPAQNLA